MNSFLNLKSFCKISVHITMSSPLWFKKNPTIRFSISKNFLMWAIWSAFYKVTMRALYWIKTGEPDTVPVWQAAQILINCVQGTSCACIDFYRYSLFGLFELFCSPAQHWTYVLCNYTFCLHMQVTNVYLVMQILNISGNFINLPNWDLMQWAFTE